MLKISSPEKLRELALEAKDEGLTVGLVPTMGYLHEGHLSLVRRARERNDFVVVSIFVNPTQFGPGEDLDKYPRDLERDEALLEAAGVDILFIPTPEEVYPEGFQSLVHLEHITKPLCGASRKGHFDGVCTVVLKLFNMAVPDDAYFGMKDYQQLNVIERMVRDLNVGVRIEGMPIVREADGLAMSSRNKYLSAEERVRALALFKALDKAEELLEGGLRDREELLSAVRAILDEARVKIDYAELLDAENLEEINTFQGSLLLAIAAFVGNTRLIDNRVLVAR
ncbi:MAG: pantoate--beta-alanine ligase [Deltaproteobacteria bacterium]|nr:MAG: pantoate--beta-alanine ligase [Deltaproteobacteria bacterium]